jgi:hypothetical protein
VIPAAGIFLEFTVIACVTEYWRYSLGFDNTKLQPFLTRRNLAEESPKFSDCISTNVAPPAHAANVCVDRVVASPTINLFNLFSFVFLFSFIKRSSLVNKRLAV